MTYDTTSDTETWNIYGGNTTVDFSISGTDHLGPSSVTGTGTFNVGAFAETYQLQQGFFPDSYDTGTTSGTFTLTYDYTPAGGGPPPATVPEISSLSYLSTIIVLLAAAAKARTRRKYSAQV
jgi:hypothetical protein